MVLKGNVSTLTENNNLFPSICLSWQNCTHPPLLHLMSHWSISLLCTASIFFHQIHPRSLVHAGRKQIRETQSQHLSETSLRYLSTQSGTWRKQYFSSAGCLLKSLSAFPTVKYTVMRGILSLHFHVQCFIVLKRKYLHSRTRTHIDTETHTPTHTQVHTQTHKHKHTIGEKQTFSGWVCVFWRGEL